MVRRESECKVEVREKMRGGSGSVRVAHFWLPQELKAKSRLCARLTLLPGSSIGFHEHNGEDEVYVILRGRGIVDEGGQKVEVVAGDTVLTGNGAGHAIAAIGTEPLEMLAVIMTY